MTYILDQAPSWSMREVAERFNVSYRTLRFYKHAGLVSPRLGESGWLYSDRDIIKIAVILQGRKLGLSVAFIADLLHRRSSDEGEDRHDKPSLPPLGADRSRHRAEVTTALSKLQDALRARRRWSSLPPQAPLPSIL